jgi:hypothetical protein
MDFNRAEGYFFMRAKPVPYKVHIGQRWRHLKEGQHNFMLKYAIPVPYRDSTLGAYMGTGRVSDPDPYLDPEIIWVAGSGSGSAFKLRIRIQEGKKITYKNRKKFRVFMFLSTGCSFLRAEGFSCSLGIFYGGLWIIKLQFWSRK